MRVRGERDVGVREAQRRFGGLDVPATLAGMLTALGLTVLLSGLVAAAGTFSYQLGLRGATEDVSAAGLVAGLVVLVLAFLAGGWVAGRMARYDGGRNGLTTALWFFVLAAALSALGAVFGERYDVFRGAALPQWFSADALTPAALASGLVALVAMLVAGWFGGKAGERYHRRVDALIANTRDGGLMAADRSRGGAR
ncbi:MAG: hypothetical protein H0V05_03715 [Euzebyaceae bacterium]|nr:hypothetical protein [Euzebyaceae bacterium]